VLLPTPIPGPTLEPLLACIGLTKSYPGVKACDDVSLSVGRGEIHALVGENGAGKSTLVKMIYGVVGPDTGRMTLGGQPFAPTSPADARRAGVGMVFQHFALFDAMTVAENIALGLADWMSPGELDRRIRSTSATYGLDIAPAQRAGSLSAGERQRVEIVRCLLQDPQLIIMDEPTSVLTPQEAQSLFVTLRRLVSEGRSVLYISHKLEEIRDLCSHATIMRGGRVISYVDPRVETAKSLAEMMLGVAFTPVQRGSTALTDVRLSVTQLTLPCDTAFGVDLHDIAFDVRGGEIIGIAGVAGNGQLELMLALIGERQAMSQNAIVVDGHPVGRMGPNDRRRYGLRCVPEERLGHGAVATLSLSDNVLLTAIDQQTLAWHGLIQRERTSKFADQIIQALDVRTTGPMQIAGTLSGGNLQKFLVGREMLQAPAVLVVAQPTWGVDAGAAGAIHEAFQTLATAGVAIVLISQDLDELMRISDRVAVLSRGRLTRPRPVSELTIEGIGLEMGGGVSHPAKGVHDVPA
jgi:general nucleoside transport system ATP-binding protein